MQYPLRVLCALPGAEAYAAAVRKSQPCPAAETKIAAALLKKGADVFPAAGTESLAFRGGRTSWHKKQAEGIATVSCLAKKRPLGYF